MQAIELFAGAGGLGMGISKAGFRPARIVEWDRWCCDTIRENRRARTGGIGHWPDPIEGDIRQLDFRSYKGKIDLVSGGPPCQPFSLGGKHRAHADTRDMWPEAEGRDTILIRGKTGRKTGTREKREKNETGKTGTQYLFFPVCLTRLIAAPAGKGSPDGFYAVYDHDTLGSVTAIRENVAVSVGVQGAYEYRGILVNTDSRDMLRNADRRQ